MRQLKSKLFLSSAIIVLVFSLFNTVTAFADDGTPPPTEEPVVTEPVPVEVEQVIEQLPADTDLVVLDAGGEALPLPSQEAAAVVVSGDPIWCPTGADPIPGTGGCTDAQSSLSDLIAVLQTQTDGVNFDYEGAGTIYIAVDYDASTDASPDNGANIDFDQTILGLTDLVVQGGWGGAAGAPSNLSGINSLNFWSWSSPLTLNDLVLDGAGWNGPKSTDTGLTALDGSGNVELNNVSVTHSDEYGVWIDTTGDVTIKNGDFSNNGQIYTYSYDNGNGTYTYTYGYGDGLYLDPSGNITLDNVSANGNYGSGAYINTYGTVNITNSQFNSNGSPYTWSDTGNDSNGYWWFNYGDSVYDGFGLELYTDGNVTLNGVSAIGNLEYGAYIDTYGTVDITDSQFNSNGSHGFWSYSDTYGSSSGSYDTGGAYLYGNAFALTNVTASDNYLDGVMLRGGKGGVFAMARFEEGAMPEEGGVMATITCSTFENNGGYGVYSYLPGTLAFNGVTFNGNAEGGYYHEGAVNVGSGNCKPVAGNGSYDKEQTREPLYIVVELLQSQLPASFDNGLTFGSAFKVELTGAGEKAQGLEITLAFPIPDGMKDADLAVMFWNGSAWVKVPGGSVVDGKYVITVNQPGLYALVSK